MKKPRHQSSPENDAVLLKRELEKGLESGLSTRTPAQIHVAADAVRHLAD